MVSYPQWTKAVHNAYDGLGGDYRRETGRHDTGDVDVVQAITRAASRWWQENKREIKRLAYDGAVKLAEELIREYIDRNGQFP